MVDSFNFESQKTILKIESQIEKFIFNRTRDLEKNFQHFSVDEDVTPDVKKMSDSQKYGGFSFGMKSLVQKTGFSLRNLFNQDQLQIKFQELLL